MPMNLRGAATLLAILILAGCARLPSDRGFSGVESALSERGNHAVIWRRDEAAAREIDMAVAAILQGELTVDDAAAVALLNNPGLQASYAALGLAAADFVEAGLPPNPIADVLLGFPTSGDPVNLEFGLTQGVLELITLPRRRSVAGDRFAAAQNRTAGRAIDMAADARIAFIGAVAARQRARLFATAADSLRASLETTEQLYALGNTPELEVMRERLLAEQAALATRQAEVAARAARGRLAFLMGVDPGGDWTIPDRLPDPDASLDGHESADPPGIQALLAASLEIQALTHEGEALAKQLGLARATALIGDLEAGAMAERDDMEWQLGPAFELPLPLFDQGQARITRAEARVLDLRERLLAERMEVAAAVRQATDRLSSARERVLTYRQMLLPLGHDVMEESLKFYNAMQIGVFALLDEKRRQIGLAASYVDALEEYWTAEAEWTRLLAGGSPSLMEMRVSGSLAGDGPETGGH